MKQRNERRMGERESGQKQQQKQKKRENSKKIMPQTPLNFK